MNDTAADTFEKAKSLFLSFGGSRYEMEREGKLIEYMNFQVPLSLEQQWVNERETLLFEAFSSCPLATDEFHELVSYLLNYDNPQSLAKFVELLVQKGATADSFTQLRFAEELVRTTEGTVLRTKGSQDALHLIDRLLSSPIVVDKQYFEFPDLHGLLSTEAIRTRATQLKDTIRVT